MAERYPIKLVRDRIREVPNVHGGEIQIWAVGSSTRGRMLRAKLLEEVGEYLIDGGEDELADILEVVECLARLEEGISFDQLRDVQLEKRAERGGFMDGYVMYSYPAAPTQPEPKGGER